MVNTVALYGFTGNLGAATVPYFTAAAASSKINLILFHRKNSSAAASTPGPGVELRELDLESPISEIAAAVRGANVFISTLSFAALLSEPKLVEALSQSPDLVTYFPSAYTAPRTEEEYADPLLGPLLMPSRLGRDKAAELGVGVTIVTTGVFDMHFFAHGFVGASIKENQVWANERQLRHRIPITTLDHLGHTLATLSLLPPSTIRNKTFSAVTFSPTGTELVDLYTKLHGKRPAVKDFDKASREALRSDGQFGPAQVAYWDKWDAGEWGFEDKGLEGLEEYAGPGLEEVARGFL